MDIIPQGNVITSLECNLLYSQGAVLHRHFMCFVIRDCLCTINIYIRLSRYTLISKNLCVILLLVSNYSIKRKDLVCILKCELLMLHLHMVYINTHRRSYIHTYVPSDFCCQKTAVFICLTCPGLNKHMSN